MEHNNTENTVSIRTINRTETTVFSHILAGAFSNNPLASFIMSDLTENVRLQKQRKIFRAITTSALNDGHTLASFRNGEMFSAAIFYLPDNESSLASKLSVLIALLRCGIGYTWKYFNFNKQVAGKRISTPHVYLSLIATELAHRKTGVTSPLIKNILDQANTKNLPVYLETVCPENIPFYEAFGFEVLSKSELLGFDNMTLFTMLKTNHT